MPLYEYECDACHQRFEVIQKFSDAPPETCARCGQGPVKRLISTPAIQFKGSGWYITDYAGGRSNAASSASAGDGESKAESKKDGEKKASGESAATSTKSDSSAAGSSSPPGSSTTKD